MHSRILKKHKKINKRHQQHETEPRDKLAARAMGGIDPLV